MTFKGCRNESCDLYHEGLLIPHSVNDSVVGGGFKCPNSSWHKLGAKCKCKISFHPIPTTEWPSLSSTTVTISLADDGAQCAAGRRKSGRDGVVFPNTSKLVIMLEFYQTNRKTLICLCLILYIIACMYIILLSIWYLFIAIYKEQMWSSGRVDYAPIASHYDHEMSAMSLSHWANRENFWGLVHTMNCVYIAVQLK